jgi:hypothetical protein
MAEQFSNQTTITSGAGTISGTVVLRNYNTSRQSIFIQNLGTGLLYVGGIGVGTDTGVQIVAGGDAVLDKSKGAAIYGISDGTTSVRFLEEFDH